MKPANKQAAPKASAKRVAALPPPIKKLTRKEKSAANKVAYKKDQAEAQHHVKALRAERIADWPMKPEHLQGKDDPDLPTDRGTKVGRPSVLYTDELDEMLFELLCIGTSLDTISALKGTPGLGTMLRWLANETHKFNLTYTRARAMVVPLYEDRALAAVLNPLTGKVCTKRQVLDRDGKIVEVEETRESDNVARSALVFGGYQWVLGWMLPKKHGQKPDDGGTKKNTQLEALFQSLKTEAE